MLKRELLKMENNLNSRRKFILDCLGITTALFGGTVMLDSCHSGNENKDNTEKPSSSLKSCDDLSGLSKSEIDKRRKLGYVKESTVPGSHCGNCNFYIPPDGDKKYGGCLLFKGPVCPTGFCTQYVAKSKT